MKNSAHKYFLCIDGITIDLNQIEGLNNMEDFLNLSIFTGLFVDAEELINVLVSLDFPIETSEDPKIEIVKRVGNKKKGYDIKPITTDILFKKASRFLSNGVIKQVLYLNRNQTDFISELLETYRKSITILIDALQKKLARLKEELKYSPVEYRADIRSEINSRKNSLKNFHSQEANILAMINLVGRRKNSISVLDRSEENEYIDRLDEFVDKETYYYRKDKRTPNNRGLVRLAVRLSQAVSFYPDLNLYLPTKAHDKIRQKIAAAIKNSLEKDRLAEPERETVLLDTDEDLQLDPDDYMFLTEEDFDGQLECANTQEQLESYEDTIENLREKQGQFSDEYSHRRIS